MQKKEHYHGSDLEKIEAKFHIRREDIKAFGANVNPLGLSPLLLKQLPLELNTITKYPDREYTALRKQIAAYSKGSFTNILVGNGSTELISLILSKQNVNKALMLVPTYSEYEHEIILAGGQVDYFYLKPYENGLNNRFHASVSDLCAALTDEYDMFVFCNPNNPTSSAFSREEVRALLTHCQTHHIMVMVDETYIEFSPDCESQNLVCLTEEYDNIVIVRGISKFFSAPGLRLGYAITSNIGLKQSVLERQNPWSVNVLADIATTIMLTDSEYIKNTIHLIEQERNYIVSRLSCMRLLTYFEPLANFILVRLDYPDASASDLFEYCIQKGLMIRDCSDFTGLDERYFRFCFMSHTDNECLLNRIASFLADKS